MKYEKPTIYRLNASISAVCSSGSNAKGSFGNCTTGGAPNGNCFTNGVAPAAGPCNNGSEAQGNCTPGTSATSSCSGGNGVGSNQGLCIAGGSV